MNPRLRLQPFMLLRLLMREKGQCRLLGRLFYESLPSRKLRFFSSFIVFGRLLLSAVKNHGQESSVVDRAVSVRIDHRQVVA
jgi:hypothetical protein